MDQFWDLFFIDLGSVLEAMLDPCWPPFSVLDPCWPPFSAKDCPRGLKDPCKTPPRHFEEVPRCIQRRFGSPKTAQHASKPAPEPSRPRFWMIFDRFLVHCWWIVDWLLIDFGLMFHLISIWKKLFIITHIIHVAGAITDTDETYGAYVAAESNTFSNTHRPLGLPKTRFAQMSFLMCECVYRSLTDSLHN